MTTFVITIPGTFTTGVTSAACAALEEKLSSQHTGLSESEGLDLLTINENNTFSVRLEVDAADRHEAQTDAAELLAAALREVGIPEGEAPLGPPAVTGIDSDF
ncbi:hypothetical protein [Streptomyces sp. NPDC058964]|uniref:hypothetical protein n=1 Tax=Streptomyces sp. NPDC058964 TaxID=3346681 RepID=UPI00368E39F4